MDKRKLSTITLYASTPFDDTYKHVVNWKSQRNLDDFLSQFPAVSENVSYQNLNKPIRWNTQKEYVLTAGNDTRETVVTTLNMLTGFNYIKIHDVDHTGKAQDYYAFITNLEYYNDGTTFVYFSIDMWNTYLQDVNWQTTNAMIQRGFVEETTRNNTNWSSMFIKVMNNPDEVGGDGCEYLRESNAVGFHDVAGDPTKYVGDDKIKFILFTAQPKDAASEAGSLLGLYSQYLYYFIAYNPQTMQLFNIEVNGKSITKQHEKTIEEAYAALAKVKEFAGSDSLIVDSEIYSYLGLKFEVKSNDTLNFTDKNVKITAKSEYLNKIDFAGLKNFEPEQGFCLYGEKSEIGGYDSIFKNFTQWARRKWGADVPLKILGNPFTKLYFTDGKGIGLTADLLKFTNLTTKALSMRRFGAISENGHETYALNNYNRDSTADQSEFVTYENSLAIDDSARDVPIVLDNYTMYLNANRNQLANVRANAKMNEKLAKQGNLISLQNTNRSLNTAQNVQAYQNARGMGMAKFDAATGVLMGGAKGLMSGGLLGGIMGAAGGAISGGLNLYKTGYNNQTAATALAMNNATAAENARANYAYQNLVATNNYEQTIRSQNAMLADTRNHNDAIAHQGSSYLVSYQQGNIAMHWQVYTCQESVMQNVILYFKLFGYEVNQYGNVSKWFHVKQHFNYVRTSNCHILGTLPNPAAETIATALDNGVTVWTDDANSLVKFINRDQTDNLFSANNPFN